MKAPRIIPLTMVTAALFMLVKIADLSRGTDSLSEALAQQSGDAAPPSPPPAAEAPKEDAKPDAAKPADAAAKPDESKKEEAKKPEEGDKPAEGKSRNKNEAVSDTPGDITARHFTAVEYDLLQNLAKRREDLDRWERNIQIKEATLDAVEKRINQKIDQIEAMKQAVADLLSQYNDKEDAKIRSLVKIYENMKPKDAARIFDEVEMPILLLVIDRMSEKKAAPILAEMDPLKAKQVTVELAQQRRLGATRLNVAGGGGVIPASGTAAAPGTTGTKPASP